MDWSEWVNVFLNLCQAVSIGVGVYFAVDGINAWKREMIGRRKGELAEETLAAFYEAIEVIDWARFPGGYAHEGKTRPGQDGEAEDLAQAKNTHYIPIERLARSAELFSKIQSHKYRFMAYFGSDAEKPFKELKLIHSQIIVAAGSLIRTEENYRSGQCGTAFLKSRIENEDIIGLFNENDPIKPQVDAVIKSIEEICKPCLLDRKL